MKKPSRPSKPIQFAAMTLPWRQLPDYPDIGSWKVNADNSPAFIGAADTGDDRSNMAILLHEIVESFLCWSHGVTEEEVSAFDRKWFEEQTNGIHSLHEEPGHDPAAPYHEWHLVAERFERELVAQMGMMWQHHTENCENIK